MLGPCGLWLVPKSGACRASYGGCGVGLAQTGFLVVEVPVARLEFQQDPGTLSMAVPVAQHEKPGQAHTNPGAWEAVATSNPSHRWEGRAENDGFC